MELRPMALAVHSEKVPLGSVWYRHGRPSGSNPAAAAANASCQLPSTTCLLLSLLGTLLLTAALL